MSLDEAVSPAKKSTQWRERLTTQLKGIRDSMGSDKTWFTPWSWVDSGGLYHGEDGFWLYAELPANLLFDRNKRLSDMLRDLAKVSNNPQVHLLYYGHTSKVVLPADLSPDLSNLLGGLEDLFSTANTLVIGVKLISENKEKGENFLKRNARAFRDSTDDLLGESVPEFPSVERSRVLTGQTLAEYGAVPINSTTTPMLESWYLLGANTEPIVTEEESFIKFHDLSTLTLAAVTDVAQHGDPSHIPSPNVARSNTCLSVRGKSTDKGLESTSVVCARRTSSGAPWVEELKDALTSASVQNLPLRQLPGLSETLPTSGERLSSGSSSLKTSELVSVGLTDSLRAGDRSGLHLGLSGRRYTEVTWWDTIANPGERATVVGAPGSGKTFMAEYLAVQAALSGQKVTYISGDGESGRPLVSDIGFTPVFELTPGLASLAYLPARAHENVGLVNLLKYAAPDLPKESWQFLLTVPNTENTDFCVGLPSVQSFTHNDVWAAQIIRSISNLPIFASVASAYQDIGSSAVSLPMVSASIPEQLRGTFADLLVSAALLRGGLVIADGITTGPLTEWALQVCGRYQLPATLFQTRHTVPTDGSTPNLAIVGANDQLGLASDQLRWVGAKDTDARRAWLRDSYPRLLAGRVKNPATFYMRDRSGQASPLTLSPIPTQLLNMLTRGKATSY